MRLVSSAIFTWGPQARIEIRRNDSGQAERRPVTQTVSVLILYVEMLSVWVNGHCEPRDCYL